MQIQQGVEKSLMAKGHLGDNRELVWSRYGLGVRASIVKRVHKSVVPVVSVTVDSMNGRISDKINEIVGKLVLELTKRG